MKAERPNHVVDGVIKPKGERSWLIRALDKMFAYETMSGNGACPVYLERWTIFYRWGYGIYLHHFIGDDWAIDPHDHPRRFISVGLWGWYWEDVYMVSECSLCHNLGLVSVPVFCGTEYCGREAEKCPRCQGMKRTVLADIIHHRAPWIRSFPANHLHRIRASECGNCWTLVAVLKKSRPWGFVQNGTWIAVKDYVFGGKSRKSC